VEFDAEMTIQFSRLRNIGKRESLAFLKVSACLDCGFLTCTIPDTGLLEPGESNLPPAPNGQRVDRACEIVPQQSAQITTTRVKNELN
jgi:hypothetical protein